MIKILFKCDGCGSDEGYVETLEGVTYIDCNKCDNSEQVGRLTNHITDITIDSTTLLKLIEEGES